MTLRLVPPSLEGMPGYAAALEAGWSPNTTRDISAEQLAALRRDPALLIYELTRQDGAIRLASGDVAAAAVAHPVARRRRVLRQHQPALRARHRRIAPHVHGHVGYAVVPWKRRRGYATAALRRLLPVAREVGLKRLQISCDDDNEPSRRVIAANGGVFERSYAADDGRTKLSFWIDLAAG